MLFFRSEEHLNRWLNSRNAARGAVLTLPETWRLAKAWYPDRRHAEWRPRTIAESQRILYDVQLPPDHAFWTLKPAG